MTLLEQKFPEQYKQAKEQLEGELRHNDSDDEDDE